MSIHKQSQSKQQYRQEQSDTKMQDDSPIHDLEIIHDEHGIHGQAEYNHAKLHNLGTHTTRNENFDWQNNWLQRGQPWRTEREIDAQRQAELQACYEIEPDIQQGRYPFSTIANKLRRQDIEWLLSRQPEAASSQNASLHTQHTQHSLYAHGLDVRGADLSKADLRGLPLMLMRGGLLEEEWHLATPEQREMAAVHMERTNLRGACLQGAMLHGAHLEGADLQEAHLEGADLQEAHLEGTVSSRTSWSAADLRMAFFDTTTKLKNVVLGDEEHSTARVADVHWNGVSIRSIAWKKINMLGDELEALRWKDIDSYRAALRANRQLSTALRAEGLFKESNYFAYHAHVNQRALLRRGLILPLVLRLLQHPQMPLPIVYRRVDQWRINQPARNQSRVLPFMLMRMTLLFLLLVLLAVLQPITVSVLLCLGIVSCVLFYLLLQRRARLPQSYQPAQAIVLSPNYVSANERQRQKHLLLLHFLVGRPVSTITKTLQSPWKFPTFMLFLATLDNTIIYCLKYIFSYFLDVLMGYGFKWGRALCWYMLTLVLFALMYIYFSHFSPQSAFLHSVTSFHGGAFFRLADRGSSGVLHSVEFFESCIGLCFEVCFLTGLITFRSTK